MSLEIKMNLERERERERRVGGGGCLLEIKTKFGCSLGSFRPV